MGRSGSILRNLQMPPMGHESRLRYGGRINHLRGVQLPRQMEHLATVALLPDPSNEPRDGERFEMELLRDGPMLIIKTPEQHSFRLTQEQTKKFIAALQRGLQRILQQGLLW